MLSIENKNDIPVFAGKESKSKLTHDNWAKEISTSGISTNIEEMIDFYWKMIDAHVKEGGNRLHIAAIGPLSNILHVRNVDPEGFDKAVQLLIMGGAIKKGYLGKLNIIPEYNIYTDRKAARILFNEASVSIAMVPLDVTANLKISRKGLQRLDSLADHDHLIMGLMEMVHDFKHHLLGKRPVILFDPATIATLLDETISTFTEMPVWISNFGFSKIKRKEISKKRVCTKLDKDRFFDLFFDMISQSNKL